MLIIASDEVQRVDVLAVDLAPTPGSIAETIDALGAKSVAKPRRMTTGNCALVFTKRPFFGGGNVELRPPTRMALARWCVALHTAGWSLSAAAETLALSGKCDEPLRASPERFAAASRLALEIASESAYVAPPSSLLSAPRARLAAPLFPTRPLEEIEQRGDVALARIFREANAEYAASGLVPEALQPFLELALR